MTAKEYYQRLLESVNSSVFVTDVELTLREIDTYECYIRDSWQDFFASEYSSIRS